MTQRQATNDLPSAQYRLMVYFAVATFHLYRTDVIPLKIGEPYIVFEIKNKKVIERVCQEAINFFDYELSSEQIGRAIQAYTMDARSLESTPAATLMD